MSDVAVQPALTTPEKPVKGSGNQTRTARPTGLGIVADLVAAVLMVITIFMGLGFWREWFSQTDSIVCSVCLALGVTVAFVRGIVLEPVHYRRVIPWICFGLAVLVLAYAFLGGRPKLCGIASGLIAAGWFSHRLKGESFAQAFVLGFAFMIPSVVDACDQRGAFDFIESCALSLTSGLAEATNQFHMKRENSIEFYHGVADRFSSVGRWDSILTFVGISSLCIYWFRRSLVTAALTCSMAFLVWMGVRAVAWVVFAWYAEKYMEWPEWTLSTEIMLFCIGAVLIVMLDQFFAMMLAPIPDEFLNEDTPLAPMLWNLFVNLPSFNVWAPQTATSTEDELYGSVEN
jgi:hypothetical protein